MSEYAGDNLLRLMAKGGLSIHQVAGRTGLDERTVRGIVNGSNKPHARTLHRLAKGLGVAVDEFFLDPAKLVHRSFDRQTNPLVEQIMKEHGELFADWTEADFDELYSRVGAGGALTREGALEAVKSTNRKRELFEKLALLLESNHAELISGVIDLAYRQIVVDDA